jgi:hypothetical protein
MLSFNGACDLAPDRFQIYIAIPLAELNANPGLRAQQNPINN